MHLVYDKETAEPLVNRMIMKINSIEREKKRQQDYDERKMQLLESGSPMKKILGWLM